MYSLKFAHFLKEKTTVRSTSSISTCAPQGRLRGVYNRLVEEDVKFIGARRPGDR
jgi:hypothetical protein